MNNHHEYSSPGKRRHTLNRVDDDDWVVDTPKRRPPRTQTYSDKKNVAGRSATNAGQTRHSPASVDTTRSMNTSKLTTASRTPPTSKTSTSTLPAPRKLQQDHEQSANRAKPPQKPKPASPAKTPIKPPVRTPIKSPVKVLVSAAANAKLPAASPLSSKTTTANDSGSNVNVNGASGIGKQAAINAKRETDKKKQLQVMSL